MEKAKHPTSKYKVFCDVYDTELSANFHDAKGYQKLQIELGKVDSEYEGISLSLFKEDVEALGNFLLQAAKYTDERQK